VNIGESNDVSQLLKWLTGRGTVRFADARSAAVRLADRAYERLGTGQRGVDLIPGFPDGPNGPAAIAGALRIQNVRAAQACLERDHARAHLRIANETTGRVRGQMKAVQEERDEYAALIAWQIDAHRGRPGHQDLSRPSCQTCQQFSRVVDQPAVAAAHQEQRAAVCAALRDAVPGPADVLAEGAGRPC
jgi:hypothetical protein